MGVDGRRIKNDVLDIFERVSSEKMESFRVKEKRNTVFPEPRKITIDFSFRNVLGDFQKLNFFFLEKITHSDKVEIGRNEDESVGLNRLFDFRENIFGEKLESLVVNLFYRSAIDPLEHLLQFRNHTIDFSRVFLRKFDTFGVETMAVEDLVDFYFQITGKDERLAIKLGFSIQTPGPNPREISVVRLFGYFVQIFENHFDVVPILH